MNMMTSTAALVAVPTAAPAILGPDECQRGAAALKRAEEIVDLLRTRYVREGWKIDDAAAEQALSYFRGWAADGSDDDDLREAAIRFLSSHGQSLDWVIDGNIGGMICGLAKHSRRASETTDAELLALEEKIIELDERAHEHDEEMDRLQSIWSAEYERLKDAWWNPRRLTPGGFFFGLCGAR